MNSKHPDAEAIMKRIKEAKERFEEKQRLEADSSRQTPPAPATEAKGSQSVVEAIKQRIREARQRLESEKEIVPPVSNAKEREKPHVPMLPLNIPTVQEERNDDLTITIGESRDYSKDEAFNFGILKMFLEMALDPRRKVNLNHLTSALMAMRDEIRKGLLKEKYIPNWTFYGLGYGNLVNLMRDPNDREKTKRDFNKLTNTLVKEGFLFRSGRKIRHIGPKLYEPETITEAVEQIQEEMNYVFEGLEWACFCFVIAPFHVVLRQGNGISITLHQMVAFLRVRHPEISAEDRIKVARKLLRRMLKLGFDRVQGKRGMANLYRLNSETLKRWRLARNPKQDPRFQNGI